MDDLKKGAVRILIKLGIVIFIILVIRGIGSTL